MCFFITSPLMHCAVLAPSVQSMERNSYLTRSVNTASALVLQVQNQPIVADRYMRHFAMSEPDLIAYFKTLHLAYLPESERFTMYSVPIDGKIHAHSLMLHHGEAVFSDSSNTPILRVRCGNPIVPFGRSAFDKIAPMSGSSIPDPKPVIGLGSGSSEPIVVTSTTPSNLALVPTNVAPVASNLSPTVTLVPPSIGTSSLGSFIPVGLGIAALFGGSTHSAPQAVPEPSFSVLLFASIVTFIKFRRPTR